jgi:hypothetical protein
MEIGTLLIAAAVVTAIIVVAFKFLSWFVDSWVGWLIMLFALVYFALFQLFNLPSV